MILQTPACLPPLHYKGVKPKDVDILRKDKRLKMRKPVINAAAGMDKKPLLATANGKALKKKYTHPIFPSRF